MFEYLQTDPIVQAMGWTLVHSLWQTIIIAIILRGLLVFISAAQARLRYSLSLLALATVLLSSVWTFQTHYRVERAAMDIKIATQSLPAIEKTGAASTAPELVVAYEQGEHFWNGLNRRIHNLIPLLPTFVLLWLTGSMMVLIWLAYSWWNANRLVNLRTSPVPAEWLQRLEELKEKMGVSKAVRLYYSEKVSDALTLKHFKPVILLPIGILNALSTAEVEAILLHELAHIRRWDYLVNCFQLVLEVLYFYHPAVWWIGRQVRESREHCCDDLALKLGGSDPLEYAQALTNLTAFSFTQKIPFAMNARGNKKDFTVRIKRLFGIHPTRTIGKSFLSAFLAGLMLLIFTLSARAEFYEFIAEDDWSEKELVTTDTTVNATLEQFLLAWLYKDPATKGKHMKLNVPLEGGMFIDISGSSGSIYDGGIPVFILNGERVANPGKAKVPGAIKDINVLDLYTIGLIRGTKATEYGISDLQQKVLIVATNDWAAENLAVEEETPPVSEKKEAPKVHTDSMRMEVKHYIRNDDFFLTSQTGRKPASIQFKISQEDNPTSYPIYVLNGKEVPINRYGKFPPSLRKVLIDSLVILSNEHAAKYGERGQEAGVFLLYDSLEGDQPVGRLTRKEKRTIESSLLIKIDNVAKDLEVGFDLPTSKNVVIEVLDQENEMVKGMTNGWKMPGQKRFNWKFEEAFKGGYTLKIEVGELVMLRDIKL